jgi:hypothetical protein
MKIENKPVLFLNAAVLTAEGDFSYEKVTLCAVHQLLKAVDGNIVSAIGHQATADMVSTILGINVPMNRISVEQDHGQVAVVFKPRKRLPEGKILSVSEIEEIGYDFFLLVRK